MFSTPLDQVFAMEWDKLLMWFVEANEVHAETWGQMGGRSGSANGI
ncbi:hypothetical protein [Hoeflea marina]|nr:hypothetical protein [Hoeflea marina]